MRAGTGHTRAEDHPAGDLDNPAGHTRAGDRPGTWDTPPAP